MSALDHKVVLVTGGLSGISRQTATLFAKEGAKVVVFDFGDHSRDADETVDEVLATIPNETLYVQGDVSKPADVDAAFARAVERFGSVDVLFNGAGLNLFKPIDEITEEDYDRTLAVNVKGTFLCCQRAIAQMLTQPGRGVIVNVASNFAFVAEPTASVYCATKGAVVSLTKGLAAEVGHEGIRVNALCPGATKTAINRDHRQNPEVIESWARKTPLRQVGREEFLGLPEEIARSALFLASDQWSNYMTGAALLVDGGWNAH
jgi:NAD(P)-dependent dehydrogenase (short-subunit alcohol dehydrogenase family)